MPFQPCSVCMGVLHSYTGYQTNGRPSVSKRSTIGFRLESAILCEYAGTDGRKRKINIFRAHIHIHCTMCAFKRHTLRRCGSRSLQFLRRNAYAHKNLDGAPSESNEQKDRRMLWLFWPENTGTRTHKNAARTSGPCRQKLLKMVLFTSTDRLQCFRNDTEMNT